MANGTLAVSQLEILTQSGTGIITVVPPATNTNRTLTLPDATGTVVASGTTPSLNGIAFPATQVPSANVNTLDDYEEGTWTPSLAYGNAGSSSFSYSNRTGKYVKIGRVVYFTADVRLSAFSKGTASGSLFMTGLPFAQEITSGYESARCTVHLYNWTYSTSPIVTVVQSNTTTIAISRMVSNNVTVDIDDPNSSSIIWITGLYFV